MSTSTNPLPSAQWQRLIGTTLLDRVIALDVFSDGSVVVAGHSNADPARGGSGDFDCFITLLGPDGSVRWSKNFGSSDDDQLKAVALAADGSIIAIGTTWGSVSGQARLGGIDSFAIKFSSTGEPMWVRQFGSPQEDLVSSLSVRPDGSMLIAGQTRGEWSGQSNLGGSDGFVLALSSDGTLLWSKLFGTRAEDGVSAIETLADGSALIAGGTWDALGGRAYSGGGDAFIAKLSANGQVQWTRVFGSGAFDTATALQASADGTAIYVAGNTTGTMEGQTSFGGQDIFIARFTTEGERQWIRQLGSSSTDAVSSLVTYPDEAVLLGATTAGRVQGATSAGGNDLVLASYSGLGALQWSYQFGSPADETLQSLGRVGSTTLYVAGETSGPWGGNQALGQVDGFVSKYDLAFKAASVVLKAPPPQASEGSSVRFEIQTTNYANGATLGYEVRGVSSADISGVALIGRVTINANGQAALLLNLAADGLTEGIERLTLVIADQSQSVNIIDSSVGTLPKHFGVRFDGKVSTIINWLDTASHPDLRYAAEIRSDLGWHDAFVANASALLRWHQQSPQGNPSLSGLSITDALGALDRGLQSDQQINYIDLMASIADCEVVNGTLNFDQNFLTSSASPADKTAPTLLSITPSVNTTVALESLRWTLTFSEPIVLGPARASLVSNRAGLSLDVQSVGTTLKASVVGAISPSSYYRLVIPEGLVADLAGNRYEGGTFEVSTVGVPPPAVDPPPGF